MPNTDTNFLSINEYELDKEWMRQPVLFYEYSKRLEFARKQLDALKNDAEVTRINMEKKVRANPTKYKIIKVTEGAINSAVQGSSVYLKKQALVNKKKYQVGVYQSAVTALDHKKKALEKLVDLHGQNYFSEPRTTKTNRESLEQMTKESVRRPKKARSVKK